MTFKLKTFNMNQFQFNIQTKIYFGENITESALIQEQQILKNAVLIVTTGRSLIKYGHLQRLIDLIKKSSPDIAVAFRIQTSFMPPDPTATGL